MNTAVCVLLYCCCLLSVLLYSASATGQTIPYNNYTLEDGLAHSNVLRLFQDSKGYLWLGTQYGLSRFDGENFVSFTTSDGLAGNTVMSMNELPDGSLLVGSHRGGMTRIRSGKVQPAAIASVPDGILYSTADKTGRLWLLNKSRIKGGLWECGYIDSNVYHPFLLHEYLGVPEEIDVFRVVALPDSSVVLATQRGAFVVSAAGRVAPLHNNLAVPVYAVVLDTAGNLWFGADDALYRVSALGAVPERLPMPGAGAINVLLAVRDGGLWYYSRPQGLFYRNKENVVKYTEAFSLSTVLINELLEDREGSLWIGTYSRGVYRIGDFRMRNYRVDAGLMSNYVSALAEDQGGRVWVGSLGGLSVIDRQQHCTPVPSPLLHRDDIVNALVVVGHECWAAAPYRIVGVDARGRSRQLLGNGGVSLYKYGNQIYVGTYRGYYTTQPQWSLVADSVLGRKRWNAMLIDGSGALWCATDNGLFRRYGDTLEHYLLSGGFHAREVYSLCLDSNGVLWCATDNGLYGYDGAWRALTTAQGLSHNRCSSVLCDRYGVLWVGTLRGVNRFDGDRITRYSVRQGLAGDEVNTLFLDSRNVLWIGTVNGLTAFDISSNRSKLPPPPLYITDVLVDDKTAAATGTLHIDAYEQTLLFRFRAVQLGNYREVLYRYKLEGSDDRWYTTRETAARYSSLPPGTYTFVVQAALSPDDWARALSARYTFVVNVPFWQTWWFVGGSAVVLALAVVLFIRLRERWFKRRQAEKVAVYSRMLNLRQQALTALVNPHFVFNSLNSIQYFINRAHKELANEYLANFADLIRRTMDDSQNVVVPLRDELSRLELYLELEALRFAQKFRYAVVIDPVIDLEEIVIPVMLIQPYVENAIWHGIMPKGGNGEVRIVVRKTPESRLHISVEDDGIGIEAAKKHRSLLHTSRGMQIMQERLELISKMAQQPISIVIRELKNNAGQPCGTRVELELPLELHSIASSAPVLE